MHIMHTVVGIERRRGVGCGYNARLRYAVCLSALSAGEERGD